MAVHPTAILTGDVQLAEDVEIGAFVVIRGPVKIGKGTVVEERASIQGPTEIGCFNRICCGAVVGGDPQDRSYRGQLSYLKVGDHNVIREYATIHRGSREGSSTIIGNNCLLMALSHIAHDCHLHDDVIVANCSLVAGHVEIFDKAIISGQVVIHQFTRIGRLGMAAGLTRITRDIPPFMIVYGESTVIGPNSVGMRRAGFSSEARLAVRRAFRLMYRSKHTTAEAVALLKAAPATPEVAELAEFVIASKRGVCSHYRILAQGKGKAAPADEKL
jgi:UDP-N-acetylglucosamine acyltransferase